MSALECWHCGSLWCVGGDGCHVAQTRHLHQRIDELQVERDRLVERVAAYAHQIARLR